MEFFDVVDTNGMPTGQVIEREKAHALGIPHRTAHVWIMRKKDNYQILLQKRVMTKDSYPGCYDISSAGHVPQGCEYMESAIRELKEELDLDVEPSELIDCGRIVVRFDEVFHGKEFHEVEVAQIYLLWMDIDEDHFICQEEEVEEVLWMDFEECKKAVAENTIPNCIVLEELQILEKHF